VLQHVVAGIPKFCAEFFFHQRATAVMFYKNNIDYHILAYSDMADHKYKSMHHQEAYVVFVQDHKKG
jgi:hypothetical protein